MAATACKGDLSGRPLRCLVRAVCQHPATGQSKSNVMSKNQIEPSQRKGRAVAPSVHVWADTSPLPEFRIDTGGGGERFGAVCVSEACLDFVSIGAALQSRFIPAGPLLHECQGQQVLATAKRQAARLAG